MSTKQPFFIIGASRSGTTLLLRMVSAHPDISGYSEIHYFDELIQKYRNQPEVLTMQTVARALRGYHARIESEDPNTIASTNSVSLGVVLNELTETNTWIEKTPQNAFHIDEILRDIPEARFISIIRDPREVALSQKHKWRRRFLGADFMPYSEAIRLFFNYHPYLAAKLWKRTYDNIDSSLTHEKHYPIVFEELIKNPEKVLNNLCRWMGVPYEKTMLDVPHKSSSHISDSEKSGIRKSRSKKHRLSNTEVYIIEKVCGERMVQMNYLLQKPSPSLFKWLLSWVILGIKLPAIFLFNLHRLKEPVSYIRKRW